MIARNSLCALALTVAPCLAQRTWIVDGANGPGTNFLNLPAALSAARDGDTILVRAGTYTAGATSKELTIVGEPGASFGSTQFTIQGLGVGRVFVLKGFSSDVTGAAGVSVDQCQGKVHLEQLTLRATPTPNVTEAPGVRITNASYVTLNDCLLRGRPAARCDGATMTFSHCTLIGNDATAAFEAGQGAILEGDTTTFSQAIVRGGNGAGAFGPAQGLNIWGGITLIAGDAASSIAAGTSAGAAPAINVTYGSRPVLTIDPAVQLLPSGGEAQVRNATPTRVRVPSLVARELSGSLRTELYSPAGSVVVLFFSAPGYVAATPFGDLWIDPTQVFLAVGDVQGPGEHWPLQFPIDANVPRGLALGLQCLSGATLSTMTLSTPVVVVLR